MRGSAFNFQSGCLCVCVCLQVLEGVSDTPQPDSDEENDPKQSSSSLAREATACRLLVVRSQDSAVRGSVFAL